MDWDIIGKIPEHWRYALMVVMIVLVITLLATWMGGSKRYSSEFIRQIQHLVAECNRMHSMSEQDGNPVVAIMHSNYAVAYANAVRLLLPDDEIRRITGIHMGELVVLLTQNQQDKFQLLGQPQNPQNAPEDPRYMDRPRADIYNDNHSISTGWMA